MEPMKIMNSYQQDNNILNNFILRLYDDINDLKQKVSNYKDIITKDFWYVYENWSEIQLKQLTEMFEQNREKEYGITKIILVLTELDTLFAIDSRNGDILWKFLFIYNTIYSFFERTNLKSKFGGEENFIHLEKIKFFSIHFFSQLLFYLKVKFLRKK